jgi:Cu-Zn family superoxide dismutase
MALGLAALMASGGLFAADRAGADQQQISAVLHDPAGATVGVVALRSQGHLTQILLLLRPNRYVMPEQFHGFHVHANDNPSNGTGCHADAGAPSSTWFVSADGHLAEVGQLHGSHDGDMPSALVGSDGTATLYFTTDRFTPAQVVGRAVVLHAGPDNFGNVPTGSAPDEFKPNSPLALETAHKTGNAGDRVACGVVRAR